MGVGAQTLSTIFTPTDTANYTTAADSVSINVIQASIAGAVTFAYITNWSDNTVSVIDISTNTVTATVPAGSYLLGVVVTPTGKKVYMTNGYD